MSSQRNDTQIRRPRQISQGEPSIRSNTSPSPALRFNEFLGSRWVDKSIAFVALLPFAYQFWEATQQGDWDLPRLGLLLQLSVIVLTIALRRPPVRVTTNPFFWLIAFVATYWQFLSDPFYDAGVALVPTWLSSGVSAFALAVSLWARLSLGRNIGFVPAERTIVTTGAYAYVRHPIYTGVFLGVLALELSDFSPRNLTIDVTWCLLWVAKTFIEEGFLRQNPEYARYMTEVRWRWIPGIA